VRSSDGGNTWAAVASLGDCGITAVAWSATPGLVLAATAEGIVRSVDAGQSWHRVGETAPVFALAFAAGPSEEVALACLAEGGIARSVDRARSWQLAEFYDLDSAPG
jgi:photosystem II stability/assembly factor-like uncharacterized protein